MILVFAVKKTGISVDLTPLRVGSLLEAEFILIEVIDCCLICFQPYRPLKQLFQVRKNGFGMKCSGNQLTIVFPSNGK